MLGGALSSWAYGGPHGETVYGITFSETHGQNPTQSITFTSDGTGKLSDWWNGLKPHEKDQFTEGNNPNKKLIVSGPMSDDDFSVITGWNIFNFADFSGVTGVEPADISGLNLPNATTIVLPTGWTEAQVKTAGGILTSNSKNGNLGTAFSKNPYDKTTEYTYYFYVKDGQEYPYTGTVQEGQATYYTEQNVPVTLQSGDLQMVVGYPKNYYTNQYNNNKETLIDENEGTLSDNQWIPNDIEVSLNETSVFTFGNYSTEKTGQYHLDPSHIEYRDGGYYLKNWEANQFYGQQENWDPHAFPVTSEITYTIGSANALGLEDAIYAKYTNGEKTEGSDVYFDQQPAYGKIANSFNPQISFSPVNEKYKYSYSLDDATYQTDEYNQEQTSITVYHNVNYLVQSRPVSSVENLTKIFAYVKVAGSFDDAVNVAGITKSSVGEIALINGINNDDLAELSKNNYANVEYINMKEAVLTGDITTLNARGEAAILLPQINDNSTTRHITDAELGTLQAKNISNPNEQYFHCLAYFKSNDASKPESKQLNIYAFDNAVGKLSNVVKAEDKIAITFVPRYTEEGDFFNIYGGSVRGFVGYQFTRSSDFNSLKEGIGQLPAISIDMEIIHNRMIPDFTFLNEHTHYIQVHGNVNTDEMKDKYDNRYDISSETEPTVYVYPNTVWVVSTYKVDESHAYVHDENGNPVVIGQDEQGHDIWQRTGLGTYSHFGGERFFAAQEPTNIVYVRDRSKLQGCDDVPSLLAEAKKYFGNDQMFASQQIFVGSYNNADIAAINNDFAATTIDFMSASSFEQVNGKDCVANLTNSKVQYLLLPDNHESVINATSASACTFSTNCTALLCVGAYNETDNRLTTWSSQAGVVANLTSKLYPMEGTHHYGNQYTTYCNGLTKVTMSGYLNRDDLLNAGGKGLYGVQMAEADFTYAYFPTYTDMVFSMDATSTVAPGYGWDKITKISLPIDERQKIIPAHCLDNTKQLSELCIPYNYEEIGESAFIGMGAKKITTTDAEGNLIDNGENSFTFSSNLKSIATKAFWTGNKGLRDVYVLAATAPKCAFDAFSSENYCGNIGFEGNFKHPVTRENYHNGDEIWFTILHFPSDITEAEAKKYTDIKREYSLVDETSAYDGRGKLKRWPNHAEISRAYDQALSGVTWNDWVYLDVAGYNTTLSSLSAVLVAKGYTAEEAAAYVQYYADLGYDKSKYELRFTDGGNVDGIGIFPDGSGVVGGKYYTELQSGVTPQTCDFYDYIGWHQFVLTDYYRATENIVPVTNFKKLDYYTFCFPYDMTRAEVLSLLGAPSGTYLDGGDEPLTADALA